MRDFITTYAKIKFNTFSPEPDMICVEDIAHALSMMTRAGGHFPEFFSVGQHSIQCCREAIARNYVAEVALGCLLHDASEAYLSDLTRPVKKDLTIYLQVEKQLQDMIYDKYLGHVPQGEAAVLIQNIDDACLYYEFLHYMDEKLLDIAPMMMSEPVYEMQQMKDVETEFLSLFHKLMREINE